MHIDSGILTTIRDRMAMEQQIYSKYHSTFHMTYLLLGKASMWLLNQNDAEEDTSGDVFEPAQTNPVPGSAYCVKHVLQRLRPAEPNEFET